MFHVEHFSTLLNEHVEIDLLVTATYTPPKSTWMDFINGEESTGDIEIVGAEYMWLAYEMSEEEMPKIIQAAWDNLPTYEEEEPENEYYEEYYVGGYEYI